jgi:molybdenum cofactor guanylyltransferase
MATNPQIAGFILAGGKSSRMGREKGLLEIDGLPIVVRTARLVESVAGTATVIGRADGYESLGLNAIGDDWPGAGPLGGIATALRASQSSWNLVVACDLPYLTEEWLRYLKLRALGSEADAVVPQNVNSAEPLCAVYNKRAETVLSSMLAAGGRKVHDALKALRVEMIEPEEWKGFDSDGLLFKNMNSPEDYEEARVRLLGG